MTKTKRIYAFGIAAGAPPFEKEPFEHEEL